MKNKGFVIIGELIMRFVIFGSFIFSYMFLILVWKIQSWERIQFEADCFLSFNISYDLAFSVMELVDAAVPLHVLAPIKATILQVEGVKASFEYISRTWNMSFTLFYWTALWFHYLLHHDSIPVFIFESFNWIYIT